MPTVTDEDGEFIRYRSYRQHTWKPALVHAGVIELAEYLGHHDPAVTLRIYGHMQQNSHDKARQIIDNRMFRSRAVGGEPAE